MEENTNVTNQPNEGQQNEGQNQPNEGQQNEAAKTYTQEEVLKLIQSETDKRVSQALATQKKKYEKQLSLSKLDDDERAKAEKDNRIAELEEQLTQFQVERNKSELKSVLSSRGLDGRFADIISITDNIEESQAKIDELDKLFKAAVKAEVEKRLTGNTPKGNGSSNGGVMNKEAFNKLSIAEQAKLLNQNREFYSQFLT